MLVFLLSGMIPMRQREMPVAPVGDMHYWFFPDR